MNKKFLSKPEGKTGVALGVGIIGISAIMILSNLPKLIALAANTLYFGALLAAIGTFLFIVLNSNSRNAIMAAYIVLSKKITSFFIEMDPIAILEDYVQQLYNNLAVIDNSIKDVKTTLGKLSRKIDKFKHEAMEQINLAKRHNENGNNAAAKIATRKASRRRDSISRFEKLYTRISNTKKMLSKIKDACYITAEDTKDEVEVKQTEYNTICEAESATQAANAILSGNNSQRANFEHALEMMADDMDSKIASMETLIEKADKAMQNMDIDNEKFDEDLLSDLEKFTETEWFTTTKENKINLHNNN